MVLLSQRSWTLRVPQEETKAGKIVGIIISLTAMSVLAVCFSRRVQNVKNWSRLPLVCWLVLLIYLDSIAFVAGTAVLSNGIGVTSSRKVCADAILLCVSCYVTTKVLIYLFLAERVYIIRRSSKTRLRDPLYLFNFFGMLVPYLVVVAVNFYYRFAIYENKKCRIGMKRGAILSLLIYDVVVNVYLTSLFLLPLRATWSYQNNRSSGIRVVALRTFIGSCATLVSSLVNLTFVVVLNGEPGWICLMCCNCDILFSALVLHWITSKDNASTSNAVVDRVPSPARRRTPPQRHQHTDVLDFQYEMREKRQEEGLVMTTVTANVEGEGDSERTSGVARPGNAIVVEFERRCVSEGYMGKGSTHAGSRGEGVNEGEEGGNSDMEVELEIEVDMDRSGTRSSDGILGKY